jgi:hypothetical protein
MITGIIYVHTSSSAHQIFDIIREQAPRPQTHPCPSRQAPKSRSQSLPIAGARGRGALRASTRGEFAPQGGELESSKCLVSQFLGSFPSPNYERKAQSMNMDAACVCYFGGAVSCAGGIFTGHLSAIPDCPMPPTRDRCYCRGAMFLAPRSHGLRCCIWNMVWMSFDQSSMAGYLPWFKKPALLSSPVMNSFFYCRCLLTHETFVFVL